MILQILAIIGFILSVYAYYAEKKTKADKKYHAICDINKRISCTKTFKSKYGHTFGISNSLLGMAFYAIAFLLLFMNYINIVFYFSMLSVIGSIYLAYVLYFKVKSFCVICNLIYAVNILLFIFTIMAVY